MSTHGEAFRNILLRAHYLASAAHILERTKDAQARWERVINYCDRRLAKGSK